MAPVALAAIIDNVTGNDVMFRQSGDAVIALNAVFGDMAEARFGKGFFGKLDHSTFGFLQADNIRVELFHQLEHQIFAQAHRVYVP